MPCSLPTRGTPVRDRVRSAAATAVAILLVAGCWAAPPASAATPDETEAPDSAETAETAETDVAPEIVVAPAKPVFPAGDDEFQFSVLIRNPGDDPLPAGSVHLQLDSDRANSAADLDAEFPETGTRVTSAEVGATEAAGEQSATVSVSRDDFPLDADSDAGVYRIQASFAPESPQNGDEGGAAAAIEPATSSVVWRGPASSDPATVSLIVPLVLTGETGAMPTRAQLSNAASRLIELLDAAEAQRATLAIDPRITAGIRAYGDAAPEVAVELLDRLERTSLDTFMLQFGDADPAAQAALGLDSLLQPEDLSYIARHGSFAAPETTEAPGSTETPEATEGDAGATGDEGGAVGADSQPTPEAPGSDGTDADAAATGAEDASEVPPGAPGLDELLSWDEPTPTAWPAPGQVDQRTVDLVRDAGITRLVVDSANVTRKEGPRAKLDGMDAIVTDTLADEAIARSIREESSADRAAGLATTASLLAFAPDGEAPHLVIGLDRGAVGDTENAAAVVEELAAISWIDTVPVEEQPAGTASLRSGAALESRVDLLQAALGREEEINALAPLLTHPEYLAGYQRARILTLFATRNASAGSDFDGIAERFQARDRDLLEGVHVISSEHTQLLGASSRVPLQVHNSLPFDAEIAGTVTPASAAISAPERRIEPTLVPAEGNQTVLVPVTARISSGESALMIELTDRGGEQVYYSGGQPLTIRAAIERIALITVGSLAALLLGFGIWRSVRRHARGSAGRTAPVDIVSDAGEAPDDEGISRA